MSIPLPAHGMFAHLPAECDWNMDNIVGGFKFDVPESLNYEEDTSALTHCSIFDVTLLTFPRYIWIHCKNCKWVIAAFMEQLSKCAGTADSSALLNDANPR